MSAGMSDFISLAQKNIHASWLLALEREFSQPYMHALNDFLAHESACKKIFYPEPPEVFSALNLTALSHVRVVILGQDPYHGAGQAHGLSFSVRKGVALPPSLKNIYRELHSDMNIAPAFHGDLTAWAQQGVLLLNSVLTVEAGLAASHQKRGWEFFTDAVIRVLNDECENLVFLLWGNYAHKKGQFINTQKHFVLKSAHPSPLSANRGGWFGCRHFSQANQFLCAHGKKPIDWAITE